MLEVANTACCFVLVYSGLWRMAPTDRSWRRSTVQRLRYWTASKSISHGSTTWLLVQYVCWWL